MLTDVPPHRQARCVLPIAEGETSRGGLMIAWPEGTANGHTPTTFPDASNPTRLSGPYATKDTLSARAPAVRFLHFATHGFFAPESVPCMLDDQPVDKILGLSAHTGVDFRKYGWPQTGRVFGHENVPRSLW